jgi:hypothetical protein
MSYKSLPRITERQPSKSSRFKSLTLALSVTLLSAGLSLCPPQITQALAKRPKPTPKLTVTKALKELKWGMSHKELLSFLERDISARYETRISSARDDIAIDKIRREEQAEKEALQKEYVSFTGQRTGYEVSVLKDDFAHNNSETMLRYQEGAIQRYYFFRYDKLWKLLVVYPSSGADGFSQLVSQVKGRYGRPQKSNWETPYGGARRLVQAIWQDAQTQLVLDDKSAFHSRFVMRFLSVEVGEEIEALHEKKQAMKAHTSGTSAGGLGVDIFAEEDKVEDVVDQITGQKHEVNMDRLNQIKAEDVPEE